MRKSRTVLTIHDLEVLKRLKGIQRFIIKLFWFTIPAQRVKYITVISGFTKQELLKVINIDPEKVVVIHNSISPDIKFTPKPFNSDKPNILHVGTAHNKNLERLIEAIDGLNVKLTVLGQLKDHHLELLQNHGIEYQNYFSLPYSHVIKQYQEADIVSFVSLYEGFGLPIIEANAIGRPVITSDCTSMPEVAGNAALIVDPYDVHKIRQGIISIINDDALRNTLIENGRINVERFKPSFIAGKYADLYLKMMKS
jgi:glycosyltransferase involved in cell wall biosynthesis